MKESINLYLWWAMIYVWVWDSGSRKFIASYSSCPRRMRYCWKTLSWPCTVQRVSTELFQRHVITCVKWYHINTVNSHILPLLSKDFIEPSLRSEAHWMSSYVKHVYCQKAKPSNKLPPVVDWTMTYDNLIQADNLIQVCVGIPHDEPQRAKRYVW